MVSGTNDRFLRKEVAIRLAYEKMEPNLIWGDFVNQIQEQTNSFMYRYDSTGKSSDTKKEKPAKYTQGGAFPEIDRSRKVTAADLTQANGFSMRIPREVIRSTTTSNEIMDAFDYAGYWMAEYINTSIVTALVAGATTPTWTPTAVWSGTTATPVEDLRLFKYQMRREGYPFRLTNAFVHIDNFKELEGYLTNLDVRAGQDRIFGIPSGGDTVNIPIAGANIRGLDSGLSEGSILGLDQNNPAAEIHYYNDPAFSMATISYDTVDENRATVRKSVNNLGIHYKQYEEDDTHDTILQFWIENKTVVTKPYGILYDTGI
jgi:hypothetical protein